ncbi:MAG: GyrI-like domain-containing protein [Anaerolineaceae bacterium]|nr:GyrI-like domain-containing protein [Anaerolineaceae bacterium]
MEKIDYKKVLKELYAPSTKKVSLVQVPEMKFLKIDGIGDPNTAEEFQIKTEALYAVAYTVKFMAKELPTPLDYVVMPLEGLWWADDMASFATGDKSKWKWTLMIMHPQEITNEIIDEAIQKAQKKKDNAAIGELRFETYSEGKAAQLMHIGSYSEEDITINKIHQFIEENGSERVGLHHEIYLSDPRRTALEKLKTVVRQPMS